MKDLVEDFGTLKIQRIPAGDNGEEFYSFTFTFHGVGDVPDKHVTALYMKDEDGLTLLHTSEPNPLFSDTKSKPAAKSFVC